MADCGLLELESWKPQELLCGGMIKAQELLCGRMFKLQELLCGSWNIQSLCSKSFCSILWSLCSKKIVTSAHQWQGSKCSQTLYLCLVTGRIFFYLSPPTSKLNNNLNIYFPFLGTTKLNCGFTIDNISNKMIEAMTCQFVLSQPV